MTNKLQATVIISGKIECVTGLHIGGTGSGYEIGGIDNPVIRNPRDGFPYIPGSSLKGKMRSMLEWAKNKVTADGIYTSSDPEDEICRIFGAPAEANRKTGPTRLIVRDSMVDEDTQSNLNKLEEEQGLPKVEIKTEVNLNRITSKPLSGPRQMERVPVGSKFDFELVYFLMDVEGLQKDDLSMLKDVFLALKLVEDSNLGGSGSRGSGQVRFLMKTPRVKTTEDYFKDAVGEAAEETLTPLEDWNDSKIEGIIANIKQKIS